MNAKTRCACVLLQAKAGCRGSRWMMILLGFFLVTLRSLGIGEVAIAAAPAGKGVWKAGFENGDAYPEINNFGRDVAEKVGGVKSPHSSCTWQTALKHSGQYAEREHTTRDPNATGPGSTHRAYCFQSWRSTNEVPIPTPIVITAWVYMEKYDTSTWTSFITLISTPTPDFPSGSITATIKAVRAADKAVVLSLPGGYQAIVWASDGTKITLDAKEARLSDLREGQNAKVDLKADGDRFVALTIEASK